MLDKLVFLLALAGTAVVFADVLVREGMLLAPVQRWLRECYNYRWRAWRHREKLGGYEAALLTAQAFPRDLDSRWWWKPLWGCYICIAGQWGFWGYLIRYHAGYSWRTVPEHLAFAAFTIIAAIILHKWIQD